MPRQRSIPTDFDARLARLVAAQGRPGRAGMSRVGPLERRGAGNQSVLANVPPAENPSAPGQMLVLSATGVAIDDGGDYVMFDAEVYRHGYDDFYVDAETIRWPVSAVGAAQVELVWEGYDGGGVVEVEVGGSVPAWGLIGAGAGTVGRGGLPVDITGGAQVRLKVTQESGTAQTADVTLWLSIDGPAAELVNPAPYLWLDAAALELTDGDPVTTWPDLSANGFDFTQVTSASRPVFQTGILNGRPGVLFDGANDFMSHNAALLDADGVVHTMFAAVSVSSLAAQRAVMSVLNSGSGGADKGWEWSIDTAGSHVYRHQSGAGTGGPNEVIAQNTGAVAVATPVVLHAQRTPTAIRAGVNGSWSTWVGYPDYDPGGFGSTWLGLMRVSDAPFLFAGHVHEVKAFNAYLSDVRVAAVMSELRTKWGI